MSSACIFAAKKKFWKEIKKKNITLTVKSMTNKLNENLKTNMVNYDNIKMVHIF